MNQRIVLSLCSCSFSFVGFCKSQLTRKFLSCLLDPPTQCFWLKRRRLFPLGVFSRGDPASSTLGHPFDFPGVTGSSWEGRGPPTLRLARVEGALSPQEHQWFEFPLQALSSEVPGAHRADWRLSGLPSLSPPAPVHSELAFPPIPWTAWPRAPHLLQDQGWAFSTVSVIQ